MIFILSPIAMTSPTFLDKTNTWTTLHGLIRLSWPQEMKTPFAFLLRYHHAISIKRDEFILYGGRLSQEDYFS